MQITPLRDWALIESEQYFNLVTGVYLCLCNFYAEFSGNVMPKLFHLMNVLRRYYNHLKLGHFSAKTFIDRQSEDLC